MIPRTRLIVPLLCLILAGCQSAGYVASRIQAHSHCPVDMMSGPPVWSPDGTQVVYMSTVPNYHPVIINVASGGAQSIDALTGSPFFPVWSPRSDALLMVATDPATQQMSLQRVTLADQQVTHLIDAPYPQYIASGGWSPDGSQVVFQIGDKATDILYVMDADGTNAHPISDPSSGRGIMASWSPDGSQLAYLSTISGLPDVVMVQADGSRPKTLLQDQQIATELIWTPDGKQIVFGSFDPSKNQTDLVVVDVEHGTTRTVATNIMPPVRIAVDGLSILHMNSNGEVARSQMDGSGTQIVLPGMLAALYNSAFSPDGTQLAYIADDNGMPELMLNDLNSGDFTRLTHNPGHRLCFR